MSKYWKPSRNGKEDFEEIYYKYKGKEMSQTECAYHLGISIMGFYKRCKYYEENMSTNYEKIYLIEKQKAEELMGKYIDVIQKFNFGFQEKLTDTLYRTCLYIVRNKDDIEDEKKLIYFSLKRKCKDIRYEESKKRELLILDKPLYKNSSLTLKETLGGENNE